MSKGNGGDTDQGEKKAARHKDEDHEIKSLRHKLKKREKVCASLKKEVEEYRDKYLRLAAEMENLRKRVEREKNDFYKYALSEFLKELLVVLDNFERALKAENSEDAKGFRQGMEAIHKQYLDLLTKKGVKPIEIKDKKFDPNLHQAFMTEESEDVDEPEIGEEFQKGYSLHDRLLRPSLVKVIVPKKDK